MNTTTLLTQRIQAGYAGLILVSHEESRAEALLDSVCSTLEYGLHAWSVTQGRVDTRAQTVSGEDAFEVLKSVGGLPEKTVLLLRDFHLIMADPNPMLYRQIKDSLQIAKQRLISLVLIMPEVKLPIDLEKHFSVIDFALPDRAELLALATELCYQTEDGVRTQIRDLPTGLDLDALLDAAAGLTSPEAEDAFALSIITQGRFDPAIVLREKIAILRKNGLVEYIDSPLTLADVGGWDAFKDELNTFRNQFTTAASDYDLTPNKGCLLVGMPGTGKSLIAPIVGKQLGIPVLRVRADQLKGSLVGQTENNWKRVMDTARALKKCALYIDEIDGMTAGAKSSGQTDGGTTASLIKAFLQDIQDSTGIYFIFTANDIDNLPDPLIDRLDVWSVELPNAKEREEIFAIHIRRRKRQSASFDLAALSRASDGFSGRQIERTWQKAMATAFNDNVREPTTADILGVLAKETPTATTMKEQIEARRQRLNGKARPVTTATAAIVTQAPPRKLHQKPIAA
jgi:AAA+ superfamily predicted ATPase